MIQFEEALEIVLSNTLPAPATELVFLEEAHGRVLAESIFSDMDMPPFDKSAVDGYAYRSADHGKKLRVQETIRAGEAPGLKVAEGCCNKIMTGAKLPRGADTIVMVEDTLAGRDDQNEFITFREDSLRKSPRDIKGANICFKGEDIKKGKLLLEKGSLITPYEVALLALAGYPRIPVVQRFKVGIITTGEELVEPGHIPSAVQIRNSNGWQLRAQALNTGAATQYYGIVPDNLQALEQTIGRAVSENDIVVMTGGVSMGDFDLVPEVIKNLGFDILFDRVAVQPGKPSTFAVSGNSFKSRNSKESIKDGDENGDKKRALFALPGNPVSSFIQFELMVKPFIYRSMGNKFSTLWFEARAGIKYSRRNASRKGLVPAILSPDGKVSFPEYHGSAHISALSNANAVAEIPAGCREIEQGGKVRVFLLPRQ